MAWQNILRECILKLDTCTVIISVQDCNHWFNKCIGARSEPINANFFINKKKKSKENIAVIHIFRNLQNFHLTR